MVQLVNRNSKPRPRFIEPMQCTRVERLPEGADWLYEIKQDGYRTIAIVDGNSAILYSMSRLNYSEQFPHIVFALRELRLGNLVLDGEIVALDAKGRARLQDLQNRKKNTRPVIFYVFDVLHHNSRDLLNLPLSDRKVLLDDIASQFAEPLRLNPVFQTELVTLTDQVKQLGLEGIVAKRASSIYIPGRESEEWQKHRFNREGTFVVGGYVGEGKRFSSLIVGEYRGEDLYYVKRVTGGFNPQSRAEVYEELKVLKTTRCPFVNLPEPSRSGHGLTADKMKDCTWLKPERRCELEFLERTSSGRLRLANFRRLIS